MHSKTQTDELSYDDKLFDNQVQYVSEDSETESDDDSSTGTDIPPLVTAEISTHQSFIDTYEQVNGFNAEDTWKNSSVEPLKLPAKKYFGSKTVPLFSNATPPETKLRIDEKLEKLKKSGNYREFFDIERQCGQFPKALKYNSSEIDQVLYIQHFHQLFVQLFFQQR